MTDEEVDRAVRALLNVRPDDNITVGQWERDLFRAGYAAGLEAAARACDEMHWDGDKMREGSFDNLACADAIRALKGKG